METSVETVVTEVAEETQAVIDYTAQLAGISTQLDTLQQLASLNADASVWVAGMLLFFVVVILCHFAYKFLRIFF